LDFKPSEEIVLQSILLCSEAAGEVTSIYSTPKSLSNLAI